MSSHDENDRTGIDWSRWEFDQAELWKLASGQDEELSSEKRVAMRDAIATDPNIRAMHAALVGEGGPADGPAAHTPSPAEDHPTLASTDSDAEPLVAGNRAMPDDLPPRETNRENPGRFQGLRRLLPRPFLVVGTLLAIVLFLIWTVPFLQRAALGTAMWLDRTASGNSADGISRDVYDDLTAGDFIFGSTEYEAAVGAAPAAYPGAESESMPVAQQVAQGGQVDEGGTTAGASELAPVDPSRRVIKDGTVAILVDSVQVGVNRLETIAVGVGGYVLETNTDYGRLDGRRATVRLAVPVDRFEDTLQRIRDLATEVESESSSGTDVTQEYVDLQAQIANLEATRARVRTFLEEADTVEEALSVNARLTEIEAEIAQRKGRLQFLRQRSAHSTVTVHLREPAPENPPRPTATPAPLNEWSARATASDAFRTLRIISRGLATLAIWVTIVLAPILVPMAAGAWLVRWAWRTRKGRTGEE